MNELATLIGQRIRRYRTQQRLTQEKLAELAGCHPTYIGQLERGEKNATIENIGKVVAALGISLSELFEAVDGKQETQSIAQKCYAFIADKSPREQEQLYKMLLEMDCYKNQ